MEGLVIELMLLFSIQMPILPAHINRGYDISKLTPHLKLNNAQGWYYLYSSLDFMTRADAIRLIHDSYYFIEQGIKRSNSYYQPELDDTPLDAEVVAHQCKKIYCFR